MPSRNLSSASRPLRAFLAVLIAIGPFQIAKLPSFRPALTCVDLGLELGRHLVRDRDEVDGAFLDAPPERWPRLPRAVEHVLHGLDVVRGPVDHRRARGARSARRRSCRCPSRSAYLPAFSAVCSTADESVFCISTSAPPLSSDCAASVSLGGSNHSLTQTTLVLTSGSRSARRA